MAVQGDRQNIAAPGRQIGQRPVPKTIHKQVHLLNGTAGIPARAELDLNRDVPGEDRVFRQVEPGAGRGSCKRRGQGVPHDQSLIRVGDSQVITLGQTEPARLVKIDARRWEFLEIGAGFIHGAVRAGCARPEQRQDVQLAGAVLEQEPPVGSEVVGQGAGGERGVDHAITVRTALETQQVA